jgi:hypothetical protein
MHVWRMACPKCFHIDSRNYFAGDALPEPLFCSCGHSLYLISGTVQNTGLSQLAQLAARRASAKVN